MELKEKVAMISKYIVYAFFMAMIVGIAMSNLLGGASYVFAGIIVSIVIIGCSLRFIRQLKLKSKSKQLALMLICICSEPR